MSEISWFKNCDKYPVLKGFPKQEKQQSIDRSIIAHVDEEGY